jgi:hypothetical protein
MISVGKVLLPQLTDLPRLKVLSGYFEYVYRPRPRPIHQDLSSEASFVLVKEWVQKCDKYHKCYQGQEARFPTRVIDVSLEDPHLLVSGSNPSPNLPYMTLSHCWGGEQPLTTTLSTIEQRKTRISMDSLPALYRDAIIVTRRLGINYLWIDSLCIIQDSKEDWATEAARMGDVYRLSYLTIFSLTSRNCHEGILVQRTPSTDLSCATSKTSTPPRSKADIFKTAPLLQRAWAVQERLLSSRILYYSTEEMFWECLGCTARESSFRFKPFFRYTPYQYDKHECTQVKPSLVLPLDENPSFPVSPPSDWHAIVAEYTRCQLTLSSDKLPALSGLASVFKRNTGYTYLAGLWKEDFANALLWYAPNNTSRQRLPVKMYRGPSWSWVSTDLAVMSKTFDRTRQSTPHADIKVVDSDIRLAGSDPMGEILYASVTIQASFYKMSFRRLPGSRECAILDTGGTRFGQGILDCEEDNPEDHGHCAGIYISQKRLEFFKSPIYVTYILIVAPVDKDCWKRIGLGWTNQQLHSVPELSTIKLI